MNGRRSLSCGRQSPCAAVTNSVSREDVGEQSLPLSDTSAYRDAQSTRSLDSDDEDNIRTWQEMFRDVYIEQHGHSFAIPIMDATVNPDALIDDDVANELEPTNEVLFHVGKEVIRAKRPRSTSSPTGYTPRASRPRISAPRLKLPRGDNLEDSNKENVPIHDLPIEEEFHFEDEGPIVLTESERQTQESNILDSEGILSVTIPEEVAASLLESSPRPEILVHEEKLHESFFQMNISDVSMKSITIDNGIEVVGGSGIESGISVRISTDAGFSAHTTAESSRNINLDSSLFLNMSSSEPRPMTDLTFEPASCESPLVSPELSFTRAVEVEYTGPCTPTRTLRSSAITPRTKVQAWMNIVDNSSDCFETPSPRKTRSQFSSPMPTKNITREFDSPGASNESPLAATKSFDGADKSSSKLQTEKYDQERGEDIGTPSSNKSSTKFWRDVQYDSENEETNEGDSHSEAKGDDMFDEPMETSGRKDSYSKIEDMFDDSLDRQLLSGSTPTKSSQDELDDTITQMEKILALADEAECRELEQGKVEKFPPNLPCDEETQRSFESDSPMECTPMKSIGKSGKKLIKNAKNSGPKKSTSPVTLETQRRLVREAFKPPKYPCASAPPKTIGAFDRNKTKIRFNTPTPTGVAFGSSTPKVKIPTPTFTSTPHKRPVDIPFSSPASSIGSPVPQFPGGKMLTPRKIPILQGSKMMTPQKTPIPMLGRELVTMSPVINYIYSTPPVVNISRAVKKGDSGFHEQPQGGSGGKGGYAFGSSSKIPAGTSGQKSGIPVFNRASVVAVPAPIEIQPEMDSSEEFIDENEESYDMSNTDWLNPMIRPEPPVKLPTDPKTPPPTRISIGGGRFVEREVRIKPKSLAIMKGSENYAVTKKKLAGSVESKIPRAPRVRVHLKDVNYYGHAHIQLADFKPEKLKLSSPEPENCRTPILAIGRKQSRNFIAQRHTGLNQNVSQNASVVEKETVKKEFVPSRIAKLVSLKK